MLERSCPERTCLLLVQPWTLDSVLESQLLSYAKKLRAKHVFIACLTYADKVPSNFVKISDVTFFTLSDIFKSPASKNEMARLCPGAVFFGVDYPKFVSLLDRELEKRGIDYLLLVGGFKEACVLAVAKYLCRSSRLKKNLKIRLVERMVMSSFEPYSTLDLSKRFAGYMQSYGCDISVSESDPEAIYLRYFS